MRKSFIIAACATGMLFINPLSAATSKNPAPSSTPSAKSAPAMSKQEIDFANSLSPMHKQIFMTIFTPELRQEAMKMMDEYVDDMDEENPMTPDMAVEQTLMNHRQESAEPTPGASK